MADARETILAAVRRNRPEPVPTGEPVPAVPPAGDLPELFARVCQQIGARFVSVEAGDVPRVVRECYPDAAVIASTAPEFSDGSLELAAISDPHDLAKLDLLVCQGVMGVAESGAVWIPESRVVHRAAPFITQHLMILLDWEHIVWDMAEAYERLRTEACGFGVFIAGPSKTSDIEQSLVVGAHGARSVTVALVWRGASGAMPRIADSG